MTTDLMEVYSLEVGDQILVNGELFRITDIQYGQRSDYRLIVVDEEGYRRHIEAEFSKKFRLVLDNLAEV
ncbi:hypothetical protein EBZ39_12880, partial [bacterium]|nr:hypothetical protein [bacterium]